MSEELGCTAVLEILSEIYETMQEYEKYTDSMINADLEVLQQALFRRNEIIATLEELKQHLEGVISLEQKEERELLETLVKGGYVSAPLDEVHKEIQLVQRNITICKQRVLDKDKVISNQIRSQQIDSRKELESLKATKKQIGYYNSAVVGRATGRSLNKNL
ncbi:MAG: hypothetical protein IJD85_06045 [Oscillospiraceae bacterium]|nr:hypothetical protein [Oscillospiraceae bacterium]